MLSGDLDKAIWHKPVTANAICDTRLTKLKAKGSPQIRRTGDKLPNPMLLYCRPPSPANLSYDEIIISEIVLIYHNAKLLTL
jgi:hypothetical protein